MGVEGVDVTAPQCEYLPAVTVGGNSVSCVLGRALRPRLKSQQMGRDVANLHAARK